MPRESGHGPFALAVRCLWLAESSGRLCLTERLEFISRRAHSESDGPTLPSRSKAGSSPTPSGGLGVRGVRRRGLDVGWLRYHKSKVAGSHCRDGVEPRVGAEDWEPPP